MTSAPRDYIKREGIVNSVSIKSQGPGAREQDAVLVPAAGRSHFGAAGAAAGFGWAELFSSCCVDLGWGGGVQPLCASGWWTWLSLTNGLRCVPVPSLAAFLVGIWRSLWPVSFGMCLGSPGV